MQPAERIGQAVTCMMAKHPVLYMLRIVLEVLVPRMCVWGGEIYVCVGICEDVDSRVSWYEWEGERMVVLGVGVCLPPCFKQGLCSLLRIPGVT